MNIPQVGTEAYYSFKDPYAKYIKNLTGVDSEEILLTLITIKDMTDHVFNDKRDPFSDIYTPVGISELEYKQDLHDEVKILTFRYQDPFEQFKTFRIPSRYLNTFSTSAVVAYANRDIVLSLPELPVELDIDFVTRDLQDLIETYLGVKPLIHNVVSSNIKSYSIDEAKKLEIIRQQSVTVNKTLEVRLKETEVHRDALLEKLNEMKIVLGE